ncbi:MAG: hypothetical protein AAGF95_20620 [Chloroflexota bacterium]
MKLENDQQWFDLKHRYPLNHIFWGEVLSHQPFGTFVKLDVQTDDSIYLGLIEIVQVGVCESQIEHLPYDFTQRPQIGSYINCLVGYYCDHNKQLELRWLGVETHRTARHDYELIG